MNYSGAPVGPTVTFDEMSDHNNSDKTSDPYCAYFDCSDTKSSSFDTEQYFECV